MHHLYLQLADEVTEQLDNMVIRTGLSKSTIAKKAIADFVTREESLLAYREQGLSAWDEYLRSGEHVTGEEASAWMKKLAKGENAEPPQCHP